MLDFRLNGNIPNFCLNEAIENIKEYFGMVNDPSSILRSANSMSDEEELPISEEALKLILDDIYRLPAVKAYVNNLSSDSLVLEKVIMNILRNLDGKILDRLDDIIDVDETLENIENKLGVRFPSFSVDRVLSVIKGDAMSLGGVNINTQNRGIPNYEDEVIQALIVLEAAIKETYGDSINQKLLNSVLREIGRETEVVRYSTDEELIDEASNNGPRKVVRDGKIVTLKRRKKRMSSAQRAKISRAMKKVKRIVKPSTIRKMLRSRAIAKKRGL